jgi:hypothetical protein
MLALHSAHKCGSSATTDPSDRLSEYQLSMLQCPTLVSQVASRQPPADGLLREYLVKAVYPNSDLLPKIPWPRSTSQPGNRCTNYVAHLFGFQYDPSL